MIKLQASKRFPAVPSENRGLSGGSWPCSNLEHPLFKVDGSRVMDCSVMDGSELDFSELDLQQ